MSNTLILNSTNVLGGATKNTYQYNFIGGNYHIKDDAEIAVSSITLPYSWFNVTTYYANKTFQFTWTSGGTLTTYTITLPDGFFSVNDINLYFQNYCIANGFYLINSLAQNVYYLSLSYNSNYYAVQLLEFAVPISLPSGYTQPSNFAGYPTTATTPQFIIPATNSIGAIIGFTAGTYGIGGTSNQSFLSNTTPNGTNVNSIVVRCSLVNNSVASPTDILDSFQITSSFGSNINYSPNFEKWIKLRKGTYSNFLISFYDQNLNQLQMNDTNVLITLLIKQ